MDIKIFIMIISTIIICFYLTFRLLEEKNENEKLKKHIKNQNNLKLNIPQRMITNEDLAFLDNLIEIYCTYYLEFELSIKGYAFISNELTEKIISEVNLKIIDYLSDEMMQVLKQRFSTEGLTTYIYMKTFPKIVQLIKKINIPK